MPLTRDFKETVQVRAQRDPAFREGLLKKGVECLLAGDMDTGKSLMRMFGPSDNPHAHNLFEVIRCIQQHEGVQLEVKAVRSSTGSG